MNCHFCKAPAKGDYRFHGYEIGGELWFVCDACEEKFVQEAVVAKVKAEIAELNGEAPAMGEPMNRHLMEKLEKLERRFEEFIGHHRKLAECHNKLQEACINHQDLIEDAHNKIGHLYEMAMDPAEPEMIPCPYCGGRSATCEDCLGSGKVPASKDDGELRADYSDLDEMAMRPVKNPYWDQLKEVREDRSKMQKKIDRLLGELREITHKFEATYCSRCPFFVQCDTDNGPAPKGDWFCMHEIGCEWLKGSRGEYDDGRRDG